MKKIIYRFRATGKISHDGNYEEYLRRRDIMSEKALAERITAFNKKQKNLFAEIVELDDVAEFYAERAEQHIDIPDDIAERLRDIASIIYGIADEITSLSRGV